MLNRATSCWAVATPLDAALDAAPLVLAVVDAADELELDDELELPQPAAPSATHPAAATAAILTNTVLERSIPLLLESNSYR